MSDYKHGNWFAKPANYEEAREIIERAVTSGAANPCGWSGNGTAYQCYGVKHGLVFYGSEREWVDATEYTIEELCKKFPLPDENEWDGKGLPPVGTVCEYRIGNGDWWKCTIRYILSSNVEDSATKIVVWCPHLCKDQCTPVNNLKFRPICSERERWVDDVNTRYTSGAHHSTVKDIAGFVFDAIKSGDLKAPEVNND